MKLVIFASMVFSSLVFSQSEQSSFFSRLECSSPDGGVEDPHLIFLLEKQNSMALLFKEGGKRYVFDFLAAQGKTIVQKLRIKRKDNLIRLIGERRQGPSFNEQFVLTFEKDIAKGVIAPRSLSFKQRKGDDTIEKDKINLDGLRCTLKGKKIFS